MFAVTENDIDIGVNTKGNAFALRVIDNSLSGHGIVCDDLLLLERDAPLRDGCFALVEISDSEPTLEWVAKATDRVLTIAWRGLDVAFPRELVRVVGVVRGMTRGTR